MSETAKVKIHFENKIHELTVHPGETILEAAQDKGLDVPYGCTSGSCGACMAKLTQGQVDMPEDAYLGPDEMAKGQILMCLSKPTSSELEIFIE